MIRYDAHRWTDHLFDLRGSMLAVILPRALVATGLAALVAAAHHYWRPLDLSDRPHILVGAALGLLLVFRTNASYDRFWEGRRLWGSMVNLSRNLARAAAVMLHQEPALVSRVLDDVAAFPVAAMTSLRREREPADPPLGVARRLSATLHEGRDRGLLSDQAHALLENDVHGLVDCLGGCERIHRTPLPFAYMVHLRRALLIYLGTLPFALVGPLGWGAVPATLFLSYILLGIEEIGVAIEDPFGTAENDLPLEAICETIARDVAALRS
jgi:putative membrane protein